MADIFDVVADPTRRELMQVLLECSSSPASSSGEISVGDLVERLGLSQPTVSKHLRVLREHGLVSVREEGQHRYYTVDVGPLETLDDWLAPFLSAGVGSAVFSAWSGAELGDTIGRRIAQSSHQARRIIHEASDRIHDASDAVAERLPRAVRARLFGDS